MMTTENSRVLRLEKSGYISGERIVNIGICYYVDIGGLSMSGGIENEQVLQKLISQMNASSPRKRVWLSESLKLDRPCYEGRDGKRYYLDKAELMLIRGALERLGIFDIKLPIVLFGDPYSDQPCWRIETEEESRVVSEIIGHHFIRDGKLTLYAAHLSELRRKLPTTTVCIFLP
jgi:uncharacterized protein (UPF0216 family)